MEEMELWETYPIIDNLSYTDVNQWEQTRLLMSMLGNMFSKKKLKSTDIIKFPWDRGLKKDTSISNEEIDRLKQKAEYIKNKRYGNNTN